MTVIERPIRGDVSLQAANSKSTPGATVRNVFPNPDLVGSGMQEIRRNYITNPRAALSVGGWGVARASLTRSASSLMPGRFRFAVSVTEAGGAPSVAYMQRGLPAGKYQLRLKRDMGGVHAIYAGVFSITGGATLAVTTEVSSEIVLTFDNPVAQVVQVRVGAPASAVVGTVVAFTDVMLALPGGYFDGSTQEVTDPDLAESWVGLPHETESVLTGVPIAGATQVRGHVIHSSRVVNGLHYPMRIIPTGNSPHLVSAGVFTIPVAARGHGTVVATLYADSTAVGGVKRRFMRVQSPEVSTSQSSARGKTSHRLVHEGVTGSSQLILYGEISMYGAGDVWWRAPGLFEGIYHGEAFSGSDPSDDERTYAWEGPVNNSPSTRFQRWADWTNKLTSLFASRGGVQEGLEIRNDVGVLSFALRGVQLDLANPEFIPGQTVRLSHRSGARRDLFTGQVKDVVTRYEIGRGGRRVPTLQVTVTDAVELHKDVTRYGAIMATESESFGARIARLATTSLAPVVMPVGEYPQQLGRTVYESSLANHFTLACNTVGAMWWVDAAGLTRFQKREASETPIYFVNGPNQWGGEWPADALHGISEDAEGGSRYLFNSAKVHVLGAVPSEHDPADWVADERDEQGATLSGSIARFGERPVRLVTNDYGAVDHVTHDWLIPFGSGDALIRTLTWNAQEDISRVPDLDIGATVYLPGRNAGWNYIIIGVHHTITPTRWLVQLNLGAVYAPLR